MTVKPMSVKTMRTIAVSLTLLLVLILLPVMAGGEVNSPPVLPVAYYGTVTGADGRPVASGTVTACVYGSPAASVAIADGQFGTGGFDQKLVVEGPEGAEVTFNVTQETGGQTVSWRAREKATVVSEQVVAIDLHPYPETPVINDLKPTYNKSIYLSWDSVGVNIGYKIIRRDQNGNQKTINCSGHEYEDSDISPGSTYTYQIASLLAGGIESEYAEKSITVPDAPPAPTLEKQPKVVGDTVTLSWETGEEQGLQYSIYENGMVQETVPAGPGNMEKTFTELPAGVYRFSITAKNAYGFESDPAYFNEVSISRTTNLQTTLFREENKIRLSWDPKPGVAGYEVYRKVNNEKNQELLTQTTVPGYSDISIQPGNTYFYCVDGETLCDWVRLDYPFAKPEELSARSVGKAVTIEWKDVPGCNKYNIYIDGQKAVSVTNAHYECELGFGDYNIKVAAVGYNNVESERTSLVLQVRPQPPQNLRVIYKGSENGVVPVVLLWDHSPDYDSFAGKYVIFKQDGQNLIPLDDQDDKDYKFETTVTGSSPSTFFVRYYYQTYESVPAELVIDPHAEPVAPPAELSAFAVDEGTQLIWNYDNNSNISGYNLYRMDTQNAAAGYLRINEINPSQTTYVDKHPTQQQFSYIITAFVKDIEKGLYVESAFSNPAAPGSSGASSEPGALKKIAGDNQVGLVNTILPEYLTVSVVDEYGRLVPGVPVTFKVNDNGTAEIDQKAKVYDPANPTNKQPEVQITTGSQGDNTGLARCGLELGNISGDDSKKTVTVNVSLGETWTGVQSVTFTAIATTEGMPGKIEIFSGNNQQGEPGKFFSEPFTCRVVDKLGKGVPGIGVQFDVTSGGGGLAKDINAADTFQSVSDLKTDHDGLAKVWYKMGQGNENGRSTVTARVYGQAYGDIDAIKFFAYRTVQIAGTPAKIQKVLGDNQAGKAGWILSDCLEVRVLDANGLGVPNQEVTFAVIGGNGTLLKNISDTGSTGSLKVTTNKEGYAYVLLRLGDKGSAGQVTVTATVADLKTQFTAKYVDESARPSAISVYKGDKQKVVSGATGQPVEVIVKDSDMTPMPGAAVVFSVASGGGTLGDAAAQEVKTDENGIARVALTMPTLPEGELNRPVKVKAEVKEKDIDGNTLACYVTATALTRNLVLEEVTEKDVTFNPETDQYVTLAVKVKYAQTGDAVSDLPVNWQVTEGKGALQAATVLTGDSGISTNYLVPHSTDVVKVTAVIPGLEDKKVEFTVQTEAPRILEGNIKLEGQYNQYPVKLKVWGVSTRGHYVEVPVDLTGATGTYRLGVVTLSNGSWDIGVDFNYADPADVPKNLAVMNHHETIEVPPNSDPDGDGKIKGPEFTIKVSKYQVQGKVVDQDGQGVYNAVVVIENPLNPFAGVRAYTGRDGCFEFWAVEGSYILTYLADGYQVPDQHSLRVENGNIYLDGSRVEGQMQLVLNKPDAAISGRAFSNGQPLKGALVWAYDEGMFNFFNTTTDTGTETPGRYTLRVRPGTDYYVEGWDPVYGNLVLDSTNPEYNKNPISLHGQIAQGVNLVPLTNNGTITGIVKIGDNPVNRAAISAVNEEEDYYRNTFTDVNGQFNLVVPASVAPYKVQVWTKQTGLNVSDPVYVSAGQTKFVTVAFDNPVTVRGKVKDTGGTPVRDAVVTAINTITGGYNMASVDAEGIYRFNLLPGTYNVEVVSSIFGKKSKSNCAVDAGTETLGDFTFDQITYTVTGTVQDSSGLAMKNVWVSAVETTSGLTNGKFTDDQGNYELKLPAGTYYLRAERPGYIQVLAQESDATVTVDGSRDPMQKDLTMQSSVFEITGHVYNEHGQGIPYASLWATDLRGGRASAVTDPTGYYSMKVTPGTWYLGCAAEGYLTKNSLTSEGTEDPKNKDLKITVNTADPSKNTLNINFSASDRVPKPKPAMAVINPQDGGTVTSGQNSLNITPTALTDYDELHVTLRPITNVPWGDTYRPLPGTGLEINAVDRKNRIVNKLKDYVQLKIAFDELPAGVDTGDLKISYYNPDIKNWMLMPATLVMNNDGSGYFVVNTNHLTKFAVVYPTPLILRGFETGTTPGGDNDDNRGGSSRGGGGAPPTAKAPEFSTIVTREVAPERPAVIASRDGQAQIEIPAGAFAQKVTLNIGTVAAAAEIAGSATTPAVPAAYEPVVQNAQAFGGSIKSLYTLEAVDEQGKQVGALEKQAVLTLRVGSLTGPVGFYYFDPVFNRLVPVRSEYDRNKGMLKAQLSHFSLYAVVVESEPHFQDLNKAAWAAEPVKKLARKNIVGPVKDSLFQPNEPITRSELTAMIVLASGVPGVEQPAEFTDVHENYWARKYIVTAQHNNLVSGFPDGTFRPQKTSSRAELVALLMRFSGVPEKSVSASPWKDVADTHWALGTLAAAAERGIIGGYPDGTMRPNKPVTRAEAVALVSRVFWPN